MSRILLIPFGIAVATLVTVIVNFSPVVISRTLIFTTAVLSVIMIARWLEARWPIVPNLPHDEVMSDWKAVLANLALFNGLAPLMLPISAAIIDCFGGGLIYLPTDWIWYAVSTVGILLISDLYRYWQHRLTHMIPFLWTMHSFHHSANAMTLVTGARHFWAEKIITGILLPILPILFVIPPSMAAIIGIIYFLPDGCAHLNVRFSMGRG